jgi:hypothetical protein
MKKQITEQNILQGNAIISVERRDGKMVDVECKPLSWAAAAQVMSLGDPGAILIHSLLNGVKPDYATDEFLNTLTPESLLELNNVITQLTHGLTALKKMLAATNLSAQQAMPTITPPPATCASKDLPNANVNDSALPS